MLARMSVGVRQLLEGALTRAIGRLLTLRRRVRSTSSGVAASQTGGVVTLATDGGRSAPASGPAAANPGPDACEPDSLRNAEFTSPDASADATLAHEAVSEVAELLEPPCDRTRWANGAFYGVGGLRLAPPPPRESETPAHRVLRLGDAPESPIHSQDPDDWEDLQMPNGEVWLAPKGCKALGDRAFAAFYLRKALHRVK